MIAVDCEGLACVVGEPGKSLSASGDMSFASGQATRETNAAARALFDIGATRVIVWDSHGDGSNLVFNHLDPRCEIMLGNGFDRRFPGLDQNYCAVLMIGYHAMEGTRGGVLAHTYSHWAYQEIRVDGEVLGEIELDASVAGELGVPLIFLSSDDHGCSEAKHFMPWIETVSTKYGLGRNCAHSKHPRTAEEEIYAGVRQSIARLNEMQLFTLRPPVNMQIQYKKTIQALKSAVRRPGWRMTGIRTLSAALPSMLKWRC